MGSKSWFAAVLQCWYLYFCRSYVQSKGRARARPSEYLLMVPEEEEKLKYAKRYQDYLDMEELSLKECHHHGTDEDEEPEVDLSFDYFLFLHLYGSG